jgi:hypothetical protein
MIDVGAAAAAEVAAFPATLALGRATTQTRIVRRIRIRNVSTRQVNVFATVHQQLAGAAAIAFRVHPRRIVIKQGTSATVTLRAHVTSPPTGTTPAAGYITFAPAGGTPIRVPWVISFAPPARNLVGEPHLSARSFAPSDVAPALVTFDAGAVSRTAGQVEVQPLARLDVELYSSNGSLIGVLARLRDLLPGRYQIGLTGRDPTGAILPPGDYTIRLVGTPTLPGPASRRTLKFTIK